MDINIGKKLDGRYEITELIGIGGMADVYKANDLIDNRTVAVKILKKEYSENEEFLRRFRNESKAIAVLSHPNIVKIYDVGFTEKIQYIVMEYIDGITLNQYMSNEKVLNWKDAVHFIIQVLRALQHAHDRGIVHRDIKPQNIMMLTDGTIKVMDFGIAKFAREDGKTATDQAIGSVHYISPEQARGDDTDEKSDIYSVGVMLYEMLTGRKPFDTDNPVSVAVMHMQSNAKRPSEVNPDILPGLEEIILKAMEKDENKRYQTAAEMIADIEKVKNDPEVVFGYYTSRVSSASGYDSATRYFKPVSAADADNLNPNDEYYDDEDYDDEEYDDEELDEDEPEAKSAFFPILSAVTIIVIIVAAFFITQLIHNGIGGDSSTQSSKITLGNLVGLTLDEAKEKYPTLDLQMDGSAEYSDYEADVIFWQEIPEGTTISSGTTVNVRISKGKQKVKVPNVINYYYEQAKDSLTRDGLSAQIQYAESELEKGYVFKTEPEFGVEVDSGTTVIVYVSKGTSKEVEVTNLVGKTIEQAQKECEYIGLQVVQDPVASSEPEGRVIGQSIEEGKKVAYNSEIVLQVSTGVPATSKVNMDFYIPTEASGRFIFNIYVGGVKLKSSDIVNVAYTSTVTVPIEGSETQEVTAVLENVENGKTATIGQFKVNFNTQQKTVISEDIRGAFEAVGGIKVETDPPVTETEPPKTEPPVTQTDKETDEQTSDEAPETNADEGNNDDNNNE